MFDLSADKAGGRWKIDKIIFKYFDTKSNMSCRQAGKLHDNILLGE